MTMSGRELVGSSEKQKVVQLAGVVILDDQKRMLLLHRNKADSVHWESPGGKKDKDDHNSEDTAKREALEELGVDVKIIRPLGMRSFKDRGDMLNYEWFLASITRGVPRPVEQPGFDRVGYFSWDQIRDMQDQLSPNMKNLLHAYDNHELNFDN